MALTSGDRAECRRVWPAVRAAGGNSPEDCHRDGHRPTAPPPTPTDADLADAVARFHALHRFVTNPHITPAALSEPPLAVARRECHAASGRVHLVVHDWSTLGFPNHTRQADRATLQGHDHLGDDLHLALPVDATDGSPRAPVDLTFRANAEVLVTRPTAIPFADFPASHVEPVAASLAAIAALELPGRLVHAIDREADSIFHRRRWAPDHRR